MKALECLLVLVQFPLALPTQRGLFLELEIPGTLDSTVTPTLLLGGLSQLSAPSKGGCDDLALQKEERGIRQGGRCIWV